MGIEQQQINIWQLLLTIFFGSTGLLTAITQSLYLAGLWRIFEKSDIKGWWVLIPWIREYRQGELINETMVGAVHVGEVRDPKKNRVTGSIALLLDKNAGELTLSVSDAKGGVYSFNGIFEPLPEGQSLDS